MNDDIQRKNFLEEIKPTEEKIKARLVEIYINGFKWFVDDVQKQLYLDRNLNGKTGYSFLTPSERLQIINKIKYGTQFTE